MIRPAGSSAVNTNPAAITVTDSILYFYAMYDAAIGYEPYCINMKKATGIHQVATEAAFILSPNPVTDELTITIADNNNKNTTILLYNNMGMLLQQIKLTTTGAQHIDMAAYAPGIYVVTLQSGDSRQSKTIIKK